MIDYPEDWKTPNFGSPPPQQILDNKTFHQYFGDNDMNPPECYLDWRDLTIPWQVDPRLGDNQTYPPDLYSLGFIKGRSADITTASTNTVIMTSAGICIP